MDICENPFYQSPQRNEPEKGILLKARKYGKIYYSELDERVQTWRFLPSEPKYIEKELIPGDILLSFYPKAYTWTHTLIKDVQWLIRYPYPEASNYIHVSLYLGEGKIAEAVRGKDGDLKINQLNHENFTIKENSTNEFHIFRFASKEMSLKVARLAKIIVKEKKPEGSTIGGYNFLSAALSPFSSKKFDSEGMKRFLKAGYFAYSQEPPFDRNGPRYFHCSTLIVFLFQAVEANDVIDRLNKKLKEEIKFPNLIDSKTKGKDLSEWSKKIVNQHKKELNELIEMNLDAKASSPADTYCFLKSNSHLFQLVYKIVSPNSDQLDKI